MAEDNNKRFKQYIKEIAARNVAGLEKFDKSYSKLIKSVAYNVTQSLFIADEIVNDILLLVWQIAHTMFEIKNPIGWLIKVTSNRAKDVIKNKKTSVELFDIPYEEKGIAKIESDDAFYRRLDGLSEFETAIFVLKFIHEYPFDSIAKILDRPQSSVSSAYYRAIERMREKNL